MTRNAKRHIDDAFNPIIVLCVLALSRGARWLRNAAKAANQARAANAEGLTSVAEPAVGSGHGKIARAVNGAVDHENPFDVFESFFQVVGAPTSRVHDGPRGLKVRERSRSV